MYSNFRKRIFIFLALFSSQTWAAVIDNTFLCNHFYVGGMLGVAGLMDRESTNNPVRDVHYLSAAGAIGGALIGYDFQLQNQWKLGLEAFANATSINISDNQNYAPQVSYTVNMRYNFGVRVLPAYEFTPDTAGHLVLGYSNAGFKINDNGNYGIINETFFAGGFQTGLGMETFLTKHVSLRSDVLYTIYSSQTSNGVTTSSPPTNQAYHNNLSSLEAELSIIYNI